MKEIISEDNVPGLTDEQLLAWGNRVVPLSLVGSIWQQATGRKKPYHRSAAIQARRLGRIIPMGKNRGRLYFWRDEVEQAAQKAKVGRPRKIQSDENSPHKSPKTLDICS